MAWFFSSAGGLVFFKHWPTFFLTFADKSSVWYETLDDTHFSVTTQVEISDQFFGWVLGFGKKAKILEPPAVVDQFAAYLDKVREMYGSR